MATYGYARVSIEDQNLVLQITALRAAGVPNANIVREKASALSHSADSHGMGNVRILSHGTDSVCDR